MRHAFILVLLGAIASSAEEPPRRPNLVVVTVAGLDGVGTPASGLEALLADPEVRTRVTPNLQRLAASGCRFAHAYGGRDALNRGIGLAAGRLAEAGYAVHLEPPGESQAANSRAERIEVLDPSGQTVRAWERLTPVEGRGRRAKTDLSVEAWERLVESQMAQRHASAVAERIASPDGIQPSLVLCQIACEEEPRVAGVFFDRFPLDQITLPADDYDRRSHAARLGVPHDTGEEPMRAATQAWLASASALDYAAGKVIDAVETANTDDDPANDWAVVLAAPPRRLGVSEIASRAGLLIAVPGAKESGKDVLTPVGIDQIESTLTGIGGTPGHDRGFLTYAERAGERYDVIAATAIPSASAARSHRFRLVHRAGGRQELYDLAHDPAGLVDLLADANAESIRAYGLSPAQVESVRAWLGWKLLGRLDEDDELGASLRAAGVVDPPLGYTAPMPGDYNRDGVVDAADKSLFRDTEGDEVPVGSGADANHDGRVDGEDGEIWRANYGRRAPAAGQERQTEPGNRE